MNSEAANTASSQKTRSRFLNPGSKIIQIGACGFFLLCTLIYFFAPALTLPPSLIDDANFFGNYEKVWSHWWEKGFIQCLREDLFTVNRGARPGSTILYSIGYSLAGQNRFLMHALLLGLLAMVAVGLTIIPLLEWKRLQPDERWPSWLIWVGTLSTVLLVGAEVPQWTGLQSLRVNWYRLHTSEPLIAGLMVTHVLLILLGSIAAKRLHTILYYSAALAAVFFAGTTKLTAMAQVGPCFALTLLLFLARNPRWKIFGAITLLATGLSISYTFWIQSLAPATGETYFTAYELSASRIQTSWKFYRESFHDILGPLGVLLLSAIVIRISFQWRSARSWTIVFHRNLLLLYCLISALAFVVAALPWPHLLPRYLLPSYLMVCIAIGLEMMLQAQWAMAQKASFAWLVAGAGIVCTILLPMKLLMLLLALVAVSAHFRRSTAMVHGVLTGITAASLLYFAVYASYSRDSTINDYVKYERATYRMIEYLMGEYRKEQVLGFMGDVQDERIGALWYYAFLHNKKYPTIKPVRKESDVSGLDLLMVEEKGKVPMRLPSRLRYSQRLGFYAEPLITRPVSFWTWRRRLWNRTFGPPTEQGALALGWTVYTKPLSARSAGAR